MVQQNLANLEKTLWSPQQCIKHLLVPQTGTSEPRGSHEIANFPNLPHFTPISPSQSPKSIFISSEPFLLLQRGSVWRSYFFLLPLLPWCLSLWDLWDLEGLIWLGFLGSHQIPCTGTLEFPHISQILPPAAPAPAFPLLPPPPSTADALEGEKFKKRKKKKPRFLQIMCHNHQNRIFVHLSFFPP